MPLTNGRVTLTDSYVLVAASTDTEFLIQNIGGNNARFATTEAGAGAPVSNATSFSLRPGLALTRTGLGASDVYMRSHRDGETGLIERTPTPV